MGLDWVVSLWPALPSLAVVTLYFQIRDARRRRAAGSQLLVTDGVDRRNVRWAKLSLKSWTGTPIKIDKLRILWPLRIGGYVYTNEQEAKAISLYDRSITLPEGCRDISLTPHAEIPGQNALRLTFFVKPSERLRRTKRHARLYVRVTGETVDAQRRRVGLLLRSGPVDWSKPPQD